MSQKKTSSLVPYINDSFDKPNCVAKIFSLKDGMPHVMLQALQDIEVNTELVYRYGLGVFLGRGLMKSETQVIPMMLVLRLLKLELGRQLSWKVRAGNTVA